MEFLWTGYVNNSLQHVFMVLAPSLIRKAWHNWNVIRHFWFFENVGSTGNEVRRPSLPRVPPLVTWGPRTFTHHPLVPPAHRYVTVGAWIHGLVTIMASMVTRRCFRGMVTSEHNWMWAASLRTISFWGYLKATWALFIQEFSFFELLWEITTGGLWLNSGSNNRQNFQR